MIGATGIVYYLLGIFATSFDEIPPLLIGADSTNALKTYSLASIFRWLEIICFRAKMLTEQKA